MALNFLVQHSGREGSVTIEPSAVVVIAQLKAVEYFQNNKEQFEVFFWLRAKAEAERALRAQAFSTAIALCAHNSAVNIFV